MSEQFPIFAAKVKRRFEEMTKNQLFVVAAEPDEIWSTYLHSFPPGTDPKFRERTEHDCSCCRHFIRDMGRVVSIENGAVSTLWDLNGLPSPYQEVADAMSAYIHSKSIQSVFLTNYPQHGTDQNVERSPEGRTITWNHFAVKVPNTFIDAHYVEKRGELNTTFQVLKRGLTELKPEAVSTVLDLINSNSIYRGAEHKRSVEQFKTLQDRWSASRSDLAIWSMVNDPVARFRNTVIGTLVEDLSNGVGIEQAVRSFETKVAPQNYKRTTALITKGMIDKAMETIAELGLEEALHRRHAKFTDVDVTSVLFVDNSVKGQMKGGVVDLLMQEVKPAPFDPNKAEEISIETFITDVLPKTKAMSLFLDNQHLGNFMSMTAPVHDDVKKLFRWSNNFAWSYDGNVTDSIKERVKQAGGMVENVALRVSLAWTNKDDLDLHLYEPIGNQHIFFGNKISFQGGRLDVDMNVFAPYKRDAVENIRYTKMPKDGTYRVVVDQYTRRESIDVGYTVEIEAAGLIKTLNWPKMADRNKAVAQIVIGKTGSVEIVPAPGVVMGSIAKEKWGVKTQQLVKVNSLVLSPNYWTDATGNKHYFFILEGCKNPEPVRGMYNEFLNPILEPHRKVFEILGDKMKCPVADEQMSGVGFSSTRKDRVTVMAGRPYTIVF